MAEETEYFWDEATELYYYYDEESGSYVPYEGEDEYAEDEPTFEAAEEEEQPMEEVEEETNPLPITTASFRRGLSRQLSFSQNGGLEGCVEIAMKERQDRMAAGFAEPRNDATLKGEAVAGNDPVAQAGALAASVFNPRERGRKTTLMRFGTRDFGNAKEDQSVAALLQRQLQGSKAPGPP
eukprot:GHVN01096070.1.p1 GENE.GHVN01096070.1~~GHVN01096070.1.p1  ORF type:complete len:181 (-),score=29.51 GHVN01096070.1:111-653(-)